jgi:hypothetical protein
MGSKEKANSRFLHASCVYTFCMTKKDLLIGGWVGVSQLLVAARQTLHCTSINNGVFVIKKVKVPNFTNVELTDMVLAYGAAQTQTLPGTVSREVKPYSMAHFKRTSPSSLTCTKSTSPATRRRRQFCEQLLRKCVQQPQFVRVFYLLQDLRI